MSTSQLPALWQTLIAALQNAIDPWIFQNPFWLESFLQIYEDSSLKWFEVIGLETSAGKCRQHPPIVRWHRTFLYDRLAWEFSARSSFCGWVTCQTCSASLSSPAQKTTVETCLNTYLSRTLGTPMHQWSFKNNCSLFSVNLMIPDIAVTFIWTFISFMKVRQVIGKGDSPITMYNRKSGASAFRYHPILLACWRGI